MQFLTRILCVIVFTLCSTFVFAQNNWENVKLESLDKAVRAEVNFLENTPVIDGKLDENLSYLPVRYFCLASKNKGDKLTPINFRIAYGTSFLYVYIEADAPNLTYRDRAYQNGDGFVVTIAKPKPNNEPADEYYDLACSAVNKQQLEWTRRIFWNYNVNKIFVRTSNETKHQFSEGNGKICFELYLPWKDVRPNHPWLSDGIGFNITFCKAVEPNGSAFYQLVDEDLRSLTKRNYTLLKFQKPVITGNPQSFVSFDNGHIEEGKPVSAGIVTLAAVEGKDVINFSVNRGGEKALDTYSKKINFKPGVTKNQVNVPTSVKHNTGYLINYTSASNNNINESQNLSVLPKYDKKAAGKLLMKSAKLLAQSSISTIQFLLDEADTKLKDLKEYDVCNAEYMNLTNALKYIDSVKIGVDPLINITGTVRKAFRSKLDNTLQPYVVRIPAKFDRSKKYPLLVYLHGSESDETNLPGYIIPEGFIAVSPFGRGTSNAFTRDNAQEDIAEAIEAVKKDFPVDDNRILLTGFSMGGYGVYRTFFETPKKFKAIAIFSGGPSLGSHYLKGAPAPDFMEDKNLIPFKGIPVFIFHGEKDRNVSFAVTNELKGKLEKAGAKVDYAFDTEEGHSAPTKPSLDKYLDWVKRVMN
jgi:predicted esterase